MSMKKEKKVCAGKPRNKVKVGRMPLSPESGRRQKLEDSSYRSDDDSEACSRRDVERLSEAEKEKVANEGDHEDKKEQKEGRDGLGRLARRFREALNRKPAKCKQEYLAMIDSRETGSTRRGSMKGEARTMERTTRTGRSERRMRSRDLRIRQKSTQRCSRCVEKEMIFNERKRQAEEGSSEEDALEQDGGSGCNQVWRCDPRRVE